MPGTGDHPTDTDKSPWLASVIAILVAMGLRALATPVLGDSVPFVFAFAGVAVVALRYGPLEGTAVALGCAVWAAVPMMPPTLSGQPPSVQVGFFLLSSVSMSLLIGRYGQRLRARAGSSPNEPLVAQSQRGGLRAARLLRATLVAAAVVPAAVFVAIAWYTQRAAFERAQATAERATRLTEEFVLRTFAINDELFARVQSLLGDADRHQLREQERELHSRLADITLGLRQVQSLWVWGDDSFPIAIDKRFPAPRDLPANERVNFEGFRHGEQDLWISERLTGRVTRDQFFNTARPRRLRDGRFGGVISISMFPGHFREFYQAMTRDDPALTLTVLRLDGVLVARWPIEEQPIARLAAESPLSEAMRQGVRSGSIRGTPSVIDGRTRVIAFRRAGELPLYVAAGLDEEAVLANWRDTTATLAAFMFPISLGLMFVAWIALRLTEREQEALLVLAAETERRLRAEHALQQSQKLEALGQLTGSVAHDFNNLLAVIGNNAHIAARGAGTPLSDRAVTAIQRAVNTGSQLTRQLLTFSRRQAVRPEVIDLRQRLPALIELVRLSVGRQVTVELSVDPDVRNVEMDASELELALINLAINARDAMPSGGRLAIHAANAPDEGTREMVQIAVSDTGHGIASEIVDRVFEPFFTTKGPGHGTGLGLSQVYGACTQAGGSARIQSSQTGTTVVLLLPASAAEVASPPGEAKAEAPPPGTRVLLVEDHPELAESTVTLLRDAGCTATHATTGDQALAVIGQGADEFDVVLSDVVMPGTLDGLELALRVREKHPDLPVVLASGYAKELRRALQVGFEVISKPYPPQALLAALARALKAARAAPDASFDSRSPPHRP